MRAKVFIGESSKTREAAEQATALLDAWLRATGADVVTITPYMNAITIALLVVYREAS